jgi:Ca2+-binding EF-hand superfamily protein
VIDDKLHFAFSLFDIDGDGYISKPELAMIIQSMFKVIDEHLRASLPTPDQFVDTIFATFDTDGDGKLSFLEYKQGFQCNIFGL